MKIRHKSIHEISPINFQFCRYNFIKFAMNMTALYICIIHNDLFQNSKKQKKRLPRLITPAGSESVFCINVWASHAVYWNRMNHILTVSLSHFSFSPVCVSFIEWNELHIGDGDWGGQFWSFVVTSSLQGIWLATATRIWVINIFIYRPKNTHARAHTFTHFHLTNSTGIPVGNLLHVSRFDTFTLKLNWILMKLTVNLLVPFRIYYFFSVHIWCCILI